MGNLNFLRQGRLGIPRPREYGVNVMLRRTRLERVSVGIKTEGGVRRGLSKRHVAFREYGLVGHSLLG
jgi:hypothetical protein